MNRTHIAEESLSILRRASTTGLARTQLFPGEVLRERSAPPTSQIGRSPSLSWIANLPHAAQAGHTPGGIVGRTIASGRLGRQLRDARRAITVREAVAA